MADDDMNDLSMFDDPPRVEGTTPQPPAPAKLVSHTESPLPEAGGVAWVDMFTPAGAKVSVTSRSSTPSNAIDGLIEAVQYAGKRYKMTTKRPGKGNGGSAPVAQTQPAASVPDNDPGYCNIHQVEMKRHEKDGSHWYSHKAGEQWCKGK